MCVLRGQTREYVFGEKEIVVFSFGQNATLTILMARK